MYLCINFKWKRCSTVTGKIGQYKVLLTYNNLVAEKTYVISEAPIEIPNTIDNIGNLILMIIVGLIGLSTVTVVFLKVKKRL